MLPAGSDVPAEISVMVSGPPKSIVELQLPLPSNVADPESISPPPLIEPKSSTLVASTLSDAVPLKVTFLGWKSSRQD